MQDQMEVRSQESKRSFRIFVSQLHIKKKKFVVG